MGCFCSKADKSAATNPAPRVINFKQDRFKAPVPKIGQWPFEEYEWSQPTDGSAPVPVYLPTKLTPSEEALHGEACRFPGLGRWPTVSSSHYSISPPNTIHLRQIQDLRNEAARRNMSSWTTVLCESERSSTASEH
ncbi:hypothetical protein B0A52_03941 [Exophiala mesophila]|uniref:Uncharacterized protein n=1 Tax=Exophiala mesophila TaxID=212818 RepID=A0A438N7L0_EXOME|nr:hypothetical protein B0A52_03941 [Exophiala mesophila]